MADNSYLFLDEHIPARSAFPAIDAHNHMYVGATPDDLLRTMDEAGVISYCNLTPGLRFDWGSGGVKDQPEDFEDFFREFASLHRGRFYGFSTAKFMRPSDQPLFTDAERFVKESIELLRRHVEAGARGLKILKVFGISHKDADGNIIKVNDPRLSDIWDAAGQLGIPVLIHQSDPYGFFQPCCPDNEHYGSLAKYTDWRFDDADKFPRKEALLQRRDNLIRRHRNTTFILPHVANFAENLAYVSNLLDENPNACIDISASLRSFWARSLCRRAWFFGLSLLSLLS